MSVKVELTDNTPGGYYRLTFESSRIEDIEEILNRFNGVEN